MRLTCIAPALILTALSSDSWGQSPQNPPPQADQKTERPAKPENSSNSGSLSRLHFVSTYCTGKRENEDAEWRKKFVCESKITDAVIAIFTIILTFFTGLLVWVGRSQARLTRDAMISTQRAFVFVRNGKIAIAKDFKTNKVKHFSVSADWDNSGDTPTKNLRMMINRQVRPEILPDDFDFPDYVIGDIPTLLGPKATLGTVPLEISIEEMREVREGEAHLYVWGWAEYDDVFPGTRRHRTEFCQKWWVGGDLINAEKFSAGFVWHHQHNGADDECTKPLQTISLKK